MREIDNDELEMLELHSEKKKLTNCAQKDHNSNAHTNNQGKIKWGYDVFTNK